jgi:YbgC/YbaW family acyl-CoA thioester hydrolase
MDAKPHVCVERVRWADVDLVGIARYSAFTRYVEQGEQEWYRAMGLPYSDVFEAPEYWMPRRHLSIEYFAPARLDEALALVTYVTRVGETSLTFNVDIFGLEDERLKAAATVVVVCVDVQQFRKQPLLPMLRDAAVRFLLECETARALSLPERRAHAERAKLSG